jgi:hypothetical protein
VPQVKAIFAARAGKEKIIGIAAGQFGIDRVLKLE